MTTPKSSLFDSFGVIHPAGAVQGETGEAFNAWSSHDEDGQVELVIPDDVLAGDWEE